MADLLHLTDPADWAEARTAGSYDRSTRGASLAEVGYVHCSWAHQVEQVAAAVYGDWTGELVVLRIDPDLLGVEVVEEDLEGTGQAFPHVYAPVPVEAVTAVEALRRVDGEWRLP
ncbi:DUF952 domain-containing protein [Aquipuribacter hungaricus]|uniref:DUF952 domain-containing protein n=1 Tax=Aquipuribacter hungaricus TaxID=545624 RepID=A0ABV7WGS5_9MICO